MAALPSKNRRSDLIERPSGSSILHLIIAQLIKDQNAAYCNRKLPSRPNFTPECPKTVFGQRPLLAMQPRLNGNGVFHLARATPADLYAWGLLFDRRMMRGVFSGRKLADYFNENSDDWINARKIVNGLEKAGAIAQFSHKLYAAISAG
jgi:hypothetical protein